MLSTVDDVAVAADVRLPPPIVGFVGNLSDRIDLAVLEAIAIRGHSLLLVGPRRLGFGGDRFDTLVARPNVQWIGERPYEQIPSYLRAVDVGITPYAVSDFNAASSPLKTLEYLAAGRASVATGLPGVVGLGVAEIVTADTPAAFADAVEDAFAVPRSAELVARRRAAVSRYSWSTRADEILTVLGLGGSTT